MSVDQVDVESSAPLYLRDRFNEVDKALQNQKETLNKAQTYATTNIAYAAGEAAKRVNLAEAARTNMVDNMAAQAKAFLSLRDQYERNPELFKRIRQMAALENVYTNVDEKWMVPPNAHEVRFQLNREPQAPTEHSSHRNPDCHASYLFIKPPRARTRARARPRRFAAGANAGGPGFCRQFLHPDGHFLRPRQSHRRRQRHDRRPHPGLPDSLDGDPGFAAGAADDQ